MYCTNCGQENPDTSKFCVYCGSAFQDDGWTPGFEPDLGGGAEGYDPVMPVAPQPPYEGGRKGTSGWIVALSAVCLVLACATVVATVIFLGGFSSAKEEVPNQIVVNIDQPDSSEVTRSEEDVSEPASEPEEEPDPEPDPEPVPSDQTPFWGVWIGAFEYRENAVERAADAAAHGLSAALIEASSEWSNLNQRGYYVVSAGTYDSQAEAEAVLERALELYPDAYVKHTGDFQG